MRPRPKIWAAAPGQKGPPLPSPPQPRTCCASCPSPGPAPVPHWLLRAFHSSPFPARLDSAGAPRDPRGAGHAARTGFLIGSPEGRLGSSQPRLPPVARPEGDEIRMRGKGERLRWAGRRAGVMKRKAKMKRLVEGKELPPKRACDTDSSRRQSGDTGGRGWASGVVPHLARHVSRLPSQPNQSGSGRLLPPSSRGRPI